jgi:hypothetical protein
MSMAHGVMFKVSSVLLTIATASPALAFGPGEAAGAPRPGRAVRPDPIHADFIVLIWYRRDDPLGTFQDQVYDVRKDEYTTAVDDWVRHTTTKYPSYLVLVRTVDLSRERGRTEKLKVGSVIQRELLAAAAQSGVILGTPVQIGPGPYAGQSQTPRSAQMPAPDRSFLNPDPTRYPIPVYPRTHPP